LKEVVVLNISFFLQQRSQPDYETNGLSYKESPDEVARKAAIRQLLEAKKKEKQTKTVKRKFQFIWILQPASTDSIDNVMHSHQESTKSVHWMEFLYS